MYDEIATWMLGLLRLDGTDDDRTVLAEKLAPIIRDRFSHPIFPNRGESLAFSVMTPKTAALAFDRVYRIPASDDPVPESVGFYGATMPEIVWWAASVLMILAEQHGIETALSGEGKGDPSANERESLSVICSQLHDVLPTVPTIFYHNATSFDRDNAQGTREVVVATIKDLGIVDERALTWEQVVEFRADTETKIKYRRLARWVGGELLAKSPAEVEDAIALRLDDYDWALKKHGIQRGLGVLSCFLDAKFLGTISAATAASTFVGGSSWGLLSGVGLAIGKAVFSIGTSYVAAIDDGRKNYSEVAYIHEIRRRLASPPI